MKELTPRKIVEELDKYIIGQKNAKRAIAIAIRIGGEDTNSPMSYGKRCCPRISS